MARATVEASSQFLSKDKESRRKIVCCGPLALMIVFAAGCGSSGPALYPVSGMVTFGGKPLDQGSIQFLTTEGAPGPAGGAVIKDGAYEIPQAHGLVPGKYRIIVSSPELPVATKDGDKGMGGGMIANKERIPAGFSQAANAPIREVKASSSNQLNIEIP